MKKKRIVCFGPGPVFKGGISNYNTSLAKAFNKFSNSIEEVHIVSWTQQYPAIIPREFIDKKSKSDLLKDTSIKVKYITNYNNPFSWHATYKYILSLKPDIVIFQWSISVQGLPLGWMARKLSKHKEIEIIFDLHFVIQKEKSSIDKLLTRYGIAPATTYITHAYKTIDELKTLFPENTYTVTENGQREKNTDSKTVIKLYHPVYDLFQPDPGFNIEAFKKEHHLKKYVFLFFGLIRKYKGLHNAIKAFKILADKRDDVSLLICGESFWQTVDQTKISNKIKKALFNAGKSLFLKKGENEDDYRPLELIKELGLENKTMVVNDFIPNEDVHKYFQVSNCVLLFYLYATPSGVESLGYNFEMPILATRVGHFPETIKDSYNGYLAEPDNIESMALQMERFLEHPIDKKNVAFTANNMSWENYAKAILNN